MISTMPKPIPIEVMAACDEYIAAYIRTVFPIIRSRIRAIIAIIIIGNCASLHEQRHHSNSSKCH